MFKHLKLSQVAPGVLQVELHRPPVLNAFNDGMFKDITACFQHHIPHTQDDIRAVVLCASTESPHFTAGLDLHDETLRQLLTTQGTQGKPDIGRSAIKLHDLVQRWQHAFTSIEQCGRPVIAAVHGGCIGAGIDLITACDVRWCSPDSFFSVKEIDLSLAADLGTLQRLHKVTGHQSAVRDWCFTGRKVLAEEALHTGLVSRVVEDVRGKAVAWASLVAQKSPIALWGTKRVLNQARDGGSVQQGLDYVAAWNAGALQSADVMESMTAALQKRKPAFSKL